MQQKGVMNGVDVGRLQQTVDAIRERPAAAKFRFRAMNRWEDGAHSATTIQDFQVAGEENTTRSRPFVLDADEPDVLLGQDHGPNATEAALYALASCLNTTFIYNAASRGVKIDELEIDLEGDLDLRGFLGLSPDVRRGYEGIRATFTVKSDAPREVLEVLTELAQKRSPVFDIVTNPTPVSVRLETR